MMHVRDVSVQFGGEALFSEVNLFLQPGHRYGLVGANGAGKTTFLKIIGGLTEGFQGAVEKKPGTVIGVLQQDHFRYETNRVLDVVIKGNVRLDEALTGKAALLDNPEQVWDEQTAALLSHYETVIGEEDGYEAEGRAQKLLTGLGILPQYHTGPMSALSGGYKLRVLLAQLLFQSPEIMLLDEPTNHLDIMSISWLENYLIDNFTGILVFISHDRRFLNALSTHILDIDYRTVTLYHGNYEQFVAAKALRYEQQSKERLAQEKQIAHLQKFVDRFGAKASKATQAQSRAKQIEKLETVIVQETTRRSPHFMFKVRTPSGKKAVEVKSLTMAFGDKMLFKDVNFHIGRGEKIALIGANGQGKSTLIKLLLAQLQPSDGVIEMGANLNLAYVAQDHHDTLLQEQTVRTYLETHCYGASTQEVRNMLGQVLFQKEEVEKSVLQISGGEATRLLLARMMLSQANCLILDEPTNHLDMESVSALADALCATQATVIVVSHDRAFVDKVADRLFILNGGVFTDFKGRYSEYDEKSRSGVSAVAPVVATTAPKSELPHHERRALQAEVKQLARSLEKLEAEIGKEEATLQALDNQLGDTAHYQQSSQEELSLLQRRRQEIADGLQAQYARWEALHEALANKESL